MLSANTMHSGLWMLSVKYALFLVFSLFFYFYFLMDLNSEPRSKLFDFDLIEAEDELEAVSVISTEQGQAVILTISKTPRSSREPMLDTAKHPRTSLK